MPANEMKARGAAFRLMQQYGIDHPREIELEAIAEDQGVTVIDAPLVGMEARLLRRGKKGVIRVRAGIPEGGRRRFAVAHELGHWFLHEGISQVFLCTSENTRDYKNNPVEIEANMFASHFLLPQQAFRKAVTQAKPGLQSILDIGSTFHVSAQATVIRYVEE